MTRIPPLVDKRVIRPAQTALALELVSKMDLLRLKAIARLYARGLPPDVGWDDLLQEALTRILVGTRSRPAGVQMTAFVAGVMLSLRSEHRRRAGKRSSGDAGVPVRDPRTKARSDLDLPDPAPGPERLLGVQQELSAIKRLFTGDALALQIITGLGEGLTAEQIRMAAGISRTDYDSARKRIRRCLLREGLTCQAN
jgi:DNA-directed RNA polymerase specialized sigma24 family protein